MAHTSESEVKNRFSGLDIIAAFCFLAALVFLIWKAPYGSMSVDETFYVNVPYRLWQGDGLIVNEWNLAQLMGFLLLPCLKLFIAVNGSTDGIFLFFRLLFVAAQFFAAVYIYIRLRRFQPFAALLASLALMLYAPYHIMALSYNSLPIILLSAACVTMLTGQRINISAPLSGLLFAGAVLCCPFLVLVYIVYSIAVLVPVIRKKLDMPTFSLGYWLRFTGSCAIFAAALFIFIFSRCSISEFFTAIPHMLNDSEHPPQSFGAIVYKYIESIYGNFYFSHFSHIIIFSLFIPLMAILMAFDKKRVEHRIFYIIPAMAITAAFFIYYIFNDRTVNYLMFPLNILGFFSCFLMKKRDLCPFVLLFLPGIMYSFCAHITSNLGLGTISSAMAVSGIAATIYIVGLSGELMEDRQFLCRLTGIALVAALLLQLCVLTYFRSRYTWWDGERAVPSVTMDRGTQKGLKTKPEKAARYYSLLDETAPVRERAGETVLYLYIDPHLYLADSKKCGSYSTWASYVHPETTMQRMDAYWQMHPDKLPHTIFIGAKDYKLDLLLDILPGTWSASETENGYILSLVS